MRLHFLPGKLHIQFVCGDQADFLSGCNCAEIAVYNLTVMDELTAQCEICRRDYDKLQQVSTRFGAEITVLRESGFGMHLKRIFQQPVLTVGIFLLVFLTLYLPSRILFVLVDGNAMLPAERIVDTAEECGIYFGALRERVRSEKVKNALISAIPELQWVGINTYGCVAVISVEEKTMPDEEQFASGISSIVAATDGIVREISATQGNALCTVGQAVKKGQVLISGYTDCGLLLIGTRAQGEIYAETRHSISSVTPLLYRKREDLLDEKKKFSLQIGKKLIKLCNDSGISDTSCVRIYKKEFITLPGGFCLPIAIVTEITTDCRISDFCDTEPEDFEWLSNEMKSYLLNQTVAGKLLAIKEQRSLDNGTCTIHGDYTCIEMIGRIQNEESILNNGSNG